MLKPLILCTKNKGYL